MSIATGERAALTLRPLVARVGGTIVLSTALITVPPSIALYFLTAASGGWPFVLLLQIGTLGVAVAASMLVRRACILIDDGGFWETGFLGRRVRTRVSDISSILVVPFFPGQDLEARDQVFVLDGSGRTRLRVRGQYWGPSVVQAVVNAFDVPVHRAELPMTPAELRHAHRGKLYFHEQHPALAMIAMGLLILGGTLPIMLSLNQLI